MTKPETVKVRLNVSRAGLGFAQSRGDEVIVSAAEAKRLIAAGHAESIEQATAPKTVK